MAAGEIENADRKTSGPDGKLLTALIVVAGGPIEAAGDKRKKAEPPAERLVEV